MENEMVSPLAITDLRLDGAGEPRVLDVDVADRLGFDRPRVVRDLINRNAEELRRYGDLVELDGVKWNSPRGTANSRPGVGNSNGQATRGRGRPGRAFLLNHDQAMIVAVLSRAPRAPDVRQQLVAVYNAYRAGRHAPALASAAVMDALAALTTRVMRQEEEIAALKVARPAVKAAKPQPSLRDQQESSALDLFVGGCIAAKPGSRVQARDLYLAWQEFCRMAAVPARTVTWFGKQMKARGFQWVKDGVVFYLDIQLLEKAAWTSGAVLHREGGSA